MSHLERPHRDKDYRHRESPLRYSDGRSGKPYPPDGRSLPGELEHSRPYADPHASYQGATHPSQFHSPKGTFSEKCSNVCSRRGILQLVEIIVNIMVLICIAATQASLSGFSSFGAFGSFSLNSIYSPFEGTELQEVRDLDMQYNQMRAPGVYGGVAFSLTMMCLTLLFLVGGAKPLHRLSAKLLFMECLFDTLACLGYITAVGLYLHFVMQVNATEVCKRRERLYARQGYTSMNCIVQGGDAAVALFGLLAACLYCASTVVCALTLRSKRELRRQEAKMQYSLAGTGSAGDPRRAPESLDGRNQVPRAFATLV
ncbi:MARVEL domain-containing protein 3-like [Varanus komodoensis]|uniref:MARVEL domain-containing protein 3-like n=1 Tax=Varanus komodoensis TaxID=61221 RepID=UPI001CF7BE15|nr:MARVEL domain-containing protein 3-like [Varanus komodoensis]